VKKQIKGLVIGGTLLLVCFLGALFYLEASNFGDDAVSGTYTLRHTGEQSTLVLRPDHSFHQELKTAGTDIHAEGNWRVSGEGHIAFSKEFLKVSGEEFSPAGQAYGQIENRFGLLSITLAPNPDGPTFHKKLFG
jgi:hypothetical protein